MKAKKVKKLADITLKAIMIISISAVLLGGIFGAILSAGSMSRIDNISIVAICLILVVQLLAFAVKTETETERREDCQ